MTAELPEKRLTWRKLFFSFQGRINRRTFLWRGIGLLYMSTVLGSLGTGTLISLLRGAPSFDAEISPGSAAAAAFLVALVSMCCWMAAALIVKRLHDRNKSGWLALGLFIPIFNLWILAETFLVRGSVDSNKYGNYPSPPPHSPPSTPGQASPKKRSLSNYTDFAFIPLVILFIVSFRTILLEPLRVPDNGAAPTLLRGDYVFLYKFKYGLNRYSCSFCQKILSERIFSAPPKRGDLVVYQLPREISVIEYHFGRVIGLPGDRVQIVQGQLVLNGEPVVRDRIGDFAEKEIGADPTTPMFREHLSDSRAINILQRTTLGPKNNTAMYVVPPDSFFALNDNRDLSLDSRNLNRGYFIPFDNLVGQVVLRWFSNAGGAWLWPGTPGFSRILTDVE